MILKAKYAVRGNVKATLLWCDAPMCFWGVVNPQTGEIRDDHHPLYRKNMSGKVLAFRCPKGSSGTGLVLMEQVRCGCAPAGIINISTDPVVMTGPLIEKNFHDVIMPLVTLSEEDYLKLKDASEVEFFADRDEIAVYKTEAENRRV